MQINCQSETLLAVCWPCVSYRQFTGQVIQGGNDTVIKVEPLNADEASATTSSSHASTSYSQTRLTREVSLPDICYPDPLNMPVNDVKHTYLNENTCYHNNAQISSIDQHGNFPKWCDIRGEGCWSAIFQKMLTSFRPMVHHPWVTWLAGNIRVTWSSKCQMVRYSCVGNFRNVYCGNGEYRTS